MEFILKDGSILVLQEEVDLLNITTLHDAVPRFLAVQRMDTSCVKVSPSDPSKAGLFDPAGPGARAGFFCG